MGKAYRGWLPRVQPIVVMRVPGRRMPLWRTPISQEIARAMKSGGWTCTSLSRAIGCSERLVTKWTRLDDDHWSYPNADHREQLAALLGIYVPPPPPKETLSSRHDLYVVKGGRADTEHPCEKPIAVVTDILRRLGSPDVLDPFAGSGTTLVAAQELGLSATGFESSTHWCERASQRLAARRG